MQVNVQISFHNKTYLVLENCKLSVETGWKWFYFRGRCDMQASGAFCQMIVWCYDPGLVAILLLCDYNCCQYLGYCVEICDIPL